MHRKRVTCELHDSYFIMVHLLVDEIFPRFGAPLQFLTDNGPENVKKIMKKMLEDLNVHHVTTSFYHPQSVTAN